MSFIFAGKHATPSNAESCATPPKGRGCDIAPSTEEQLLEKLSTLSPPRGTPSEHLGSPPEEAGLVAKLLNDHTEDSSEKEEELGEGLNSTGTSDPTESLDRLADLRKQLESLDEGDVAESLGGGGVAERLGEGGVAEGVFNAIINVEPPTPVVEKPFVGVEEKFTVGQGLQTKMTLHFTPTSLRGSPDQCAVDDWVQRMENRAREWAAMVVLALEHLHAYGIVCRDLNPANLLLDNNGA